MDQKYYLLLEDFEARTSLSLGPISTRRIPKERELFHFEADELLHEGDCTGQKMVKEILNFFTGDYKVVRVSNDLLNEQNQTASRTNVTARLKTKLIFK